jgi:hypothetical protein
MTKLSKRRVLRHLTIWTLGFAFEFWGYYSRMASYTPLEWVETTYNCVALILATYIIHAFAVKFFDAAPSYIEFIKFPRSEKYRLLTNGYLLGICCVILVYVALSFWLDNQFFGSGYKQIVLQLKGRFYRLSLFILVGVGYGYHKSQMKKSKRQLDIANWRVKIYQDTTSYIKTLLDKLNIN